MFDREEVFERPNESVDFVDLEAIENKQELAVQQKIAEILERLVRIQLKHHQRG
jgi:hypothetical protein